MLKKYSKPICTDTAVCMCYFSSAGFIRPRMNFLYVKSVLDEAQIPLFTAECVIGDIPQLIQNPTLLTRSKSSLFYKERLFNLLDPLIPEQYTKLVFIDADIIFSDPNWLDLISKKLEDTDIIQPFKAAFYLGANLQTVENRINSFMYESRNGTINKTSHPGFAWALRRDYFQKIGGFFDKAILGSGDTFLAYGLFKYFEPSYKFIGSKFKLYQEKAFAIPKRMGFLDIGIYHLNHGLIRERNYYGRHTIPKLLNIIKWEDIIDETGEMYEIKDLAVNNHIKMYFLSRNEDSIEK